MNIFKTPADNSPEVLKSPEPGSSIPVTMFDLSKRYDIYCYIPSEDRLYEDVRIVGIKTFESKKNDFMTALIGGYIEIEAKNGTGMMIPHIRVYMICEHDAQPAYKVLRVRKSGDNDGS
jgi:hypothetical protein